jgi:hypothetical protein
VVVLGIFIGLQVTDWNEDRKHARLTAGYIASLRADLAIDQRSAEQRVRYFSTVQSYGEVALAYLNAAQAGQPTTDPVTSLIALQLASNAWEYRQPRATYDDLRATGNLPLLGDMALRIEVASFYQQTEQKQTQLELTPEYRRHIRMLIPPDLQQLIQETCERTSNDVYLTLTLDPACKVNLPLDRTARTLAAIVASPGIVGDLTYWQSQQRLRVFLYRSQAEVAARMAARL